MKKTIYLVLDNIRSRENVGSIFRTSDAAGISKIYLCGTTPTPPHEKISKTALGAETYVPWEYYKQTYVLLKKLKKEGVSIIALEQTKDADNIFMFGGETSKHSKHSKHTSKHMVLVLGNEVKGISLKILKYCDRKVFIPMHGKKESLNVSVAAGIALYQLRYGYRKS